MSKITMRPLVRSPSICLRCCYASGTSTSQTPPMLLKIRSDLKNAMKNKDTTRLNVLRALLAETTNAAKTQNPIKTDIQLLSLLRRRAENSRTAALEFRNADRQDLSQKEEGQIAVLEEYAGEIKTLSEEEVRDLIRKAAQATQTDGVKPNKGSIIKKLFEPGGLMDGKPVDRGQVAKFVTEMLDRSEV